jgi:serine/threonine protein kinase
VILKTKYSKPTGFVLPFTFYLFPFAFKEVHMLAPNTVLQNRYLIVRSIGHGGMGAVYLARDQRLGNTVALKETFFTEERMRKAFEREARLLAHLRHPALPKVTDHFEEEGGQFIIMEFISGDDLEILLAQRGRPFEVEQVLSWGNELLKALDYLHKQDPPILHRDIKPANLKLTPQGEIILLDFGLAKGTAGQTSSVMTSRSVFGFTPNFAPLEQIQGTGTGPRSDLYALGATLYYLMTGVIPPDALTRITQVANGQPDPLLRPDEINPEIPEAVADLLMKTMAHNRDHRPANAAEMRRSLRDACPSLITNEGREFKVGVGDQLAMHSTLIEQLPTEEVPAVAVETSPTPTVASPTAKPVSKLETESEEIAPHTLPQRRSLRLPWAIAGFVVLLLIGITIGLVANANADKAEAEKTSQASQPATKDASSTAAPTEIVNQETTQAVDNPQTDAAKEAPVEPQKVAQRKNTPATRTPVQKHSVVPSPQDSNTQGVRPIQNTTGTDQNKTNQDKLINQQLMRQGKKNELPQQRAVKQF